MKKVQFYIMIGALSILMASCEKDNGSSDASYSSFKVNPPALTSDSKAYVDVNFTTSLSRILFETDDPLYINGVEFRLRKDGEGSSAVWYAERNDGSTEKVMNDDGYFYCCYADGAVSDYNSTNHTYNVNIANTNTSTTGIVLAGNTDDNVVTLEPCFAVLVFKPKAPKTVDDYFSIKVGFSVNGVPNTYTVSASENSISSQSSWFPAVTDNSPGSSSFLTMKKKTDYYYVAVPIIGSSRSIKLFMEYNLNDENSTVIRHATKGNVTLEKGKVYMLPDETRDGYAFNSDGAGVGVFSVSENQTVNFSAGNLQCTPQWASRAWRFAEHQYDILANDNASVGNNYSGWIDLFGYGTSGKKVGSNSYKFQPFEVSGTFYSSNIDGTFADWGVANNNSNANWGYSPANSANKDVIKYGNAITNRSWRTLTMYEWDYLLNTRTDADDKKGCATVNGVSGLVILPDTWPQIPIEDLPDFNPTTGYGNNNYTIEQWDKMEKAGAIFLPAGGYRDGKGELSVKQPTNGYYWTTTFHEDGKSYRIVFASNNRGSIASQSSSFGMCVRLVSNTIPSNK